MIQRTETGAATGDAPMPQALARALDRELRWLGEMISYRITAHFNPDQAGTAPQPPLLTREASAYDALVFAQHLGVSERIIAMLAVAPSLRPETLDPLLMRNTTLDRGFTEFGAIVPPQGGVWPTWQTALFVLAGDDLAERSAVAALLDNAGPLVQAELLAFGVAQTDGHASRRLLPGAALRRTIDTGGALVPDLSADLLAQPLRTELTWDDLVLPPATMDALETIVTWVEHRAEMSSGAQPFRQFAPGYRSLFYGPPGTGKTLAATLLGQRIGQPVYRVDLSRVVSKWIGETEKNLSALFAQAEALGWVLFFDEADALFGTRTEVRSSNDRHANQDVAYLLQRIEQFDGLVLLASNLKANIDAAFSRRLQSFVHFPAPGPAERLRLWQALLGDSPWQGNDLDLPALAEEMELTGGTLVNIVRQAILAARGRGEDQLSMADLRAAIALDKRKDGKAVGRAGP